MSETVAEAPDTAGSAPAPLPPPGRLGGRIALARLRDLVLVPAIIAIAIVGQVVNPSSPAGTT